MKTVRALLMIPVLSAVLVFFTGCDDGSAEKAGENIDEAVEKTGDKIKEGAEETKEAVKEGAEKVKDAVDK